MEERDDKPQDGALIIEERPAGRARRPDDDDDEKEDEARETLQAILDRMQLECTVGTRDDEERIVLDVDGPDAGRAIGKKGATLDALQFLLKGAEIAVNALQDTLIDAIRGALPAWGKDQLESGIEVTSKGVLGAFESGGWDAVDARRSLLGALVEVLAAEVGARVLGSAHVLETHTHADHVSGHGRLAAATGAVIHVHRDAGLAAGGGGVGADPADEDLGHVEVVADRQAGRDLLQILQVVDLVPLQPLAADGGDREAHVLERLFALLGRDDELAHRRPAGRFCARLRRGRRQGHAPGQGQPCCS